MRFEFVSHTPISGPAGSTNGDTIFIRRRCRETHTILRNRLRAPFKSVNEMLSVSYKKIFKKFRYARGERKFVAQK